MSYYVYPDGTITEEPLSFMSDDYFIIQAEGYEEAYETALTLSQKISVHRNSIVRCVEELQKKNLIEVIEGKSSRNRVQYSYRVKGIYEYLSEMDVEQVAL